MLLFTFLFFIGCVTLFLLLELFEEAVTKLVVLLFSFDVPVLYEFVNCFLFLPKSPGLAFKLFELPEPSR